MNMPSGAVSIFFILMVGYGVRKQSNRWLWIIACEDYPVIISTLLGYANC